MLSLSPRFQIKPSAKKTSLMESVEQTSKQKARIVKGNSGVNSVSNAPWSRILHITLCQSPPRQVEKHP